MRGELFNNKTEIKHMASTQLVDDIIEVIADVLEMEIDEIELDSRIVADLGADSLDIVDMSFSLGKQLSIKMPQKTVMMHAEDILGDASDMLDNDAVTELGAELLRSGPNRYSEEDVYPGKTLAEIFADTKVCHWVNLCTAIKDSGLSGDDLIQQQVKAVLETEAA
jgi:acyl carrier protein